MTAVLKVHTGRRFVGVGTEQAFLLEGERQWFVVKPRGRAWNSLSKRLRLGKLKRMPYQLSLQAAPRD